MALIMLMTAIFYGVLSNVTILSDSKHHQRDQMKTYKRSSEDYQDPEVVFEKT